MSVKNPGTVEQSVKAARRLSSVYSGRIFDRGRPTFQPGVENACDYKYYSPRPYAKPMFARKYYIKNKSTQRAQTSANAKI